MIYAFLASVLIAFFLSAYVKKRATDRLKAGFEREHMCLANLFKDASKNAASYKAEADYYRAVVSRSDKLMVEAADLMRAAVSTLRRR